MSDRTYLRLLILITIAAWGVRIAVTERFIGLTSPLDRADGMDEVDYELFAHQLSRGQGFTLEDGTPTARRAPGTSLFILPVYLLCGRSLAAARIWFTLLSALNCAAAAWVVRRHGGPAIALIAAAAMAVNPGLFYYALHLWSEVPCALVLTLTVGCLLRAVERNSRGWSLLAGVGWGAAALLRPQVVLIAPCILIGLWWLRAEERKLWLRELVREALVAAALISPWLIRNQIVIGSPTMATLVGGHTFWGAHNGSTFHDDRYRGMWHHYRDDPGIVFPLEGTELEQGRQAWENGLHCLAMYAHDFPELLTWKLYRLVTPFEPTANEAVYLAFAFTWIASIPLIALGIPRLKRLDPNLSWWIVLQCGAVVLSALIFYGAARFRHALEPFLMMWLAAGAVSLWEISGMSKRIESRRAE